MNQSVRQQKQQHERVRAAHAVSALDDARCQLFRQSSHSSGAMPMVACDP
jgi:hypothetical protein